jgi:hypothetical protein
MLCNLASLFQKIRGLFKLSLLIKINYTHFQNLNHHQSKILIFNRI